MATADQRGGFTIPWPVGKSEVTVTSWAPGFFVGWKEARRGEAPITIVLVAHYTTDDVDYDWFAEGGAVGSASCSHCMPSFVEWLRDAHSRTAVNGRFLSMYNGSDLNGRRSPPTRFVDDSVLGRVPVAPDPTRPYRGPGFRLDFPSEAGNCATCHLPVAAVSRAGPFVDANNQTGVARDGVACDFCHKVGAVVLDPETRLPHPDRPGVLSMKLHRPSPGQQLFFGPFDDVTRRVSRLDLISESEFCAPCHYGVFNGVTVYNSYGEWLASPYSDPETGKTCQVCHMPLAGYDYFVYPDRGGLRRDPKLIRSHHMPGASSEALLRESVTMEVRTERRNGGLAVHVEIVNDKTGHHVPTDSPLRHMILVVEAFDGAGNRLKHVWGPVLPGWCGTGDPAAGNFGGLPGKVFAKVLEELGTGVLPTAAYWNRTRLVADTRLAAFARDESLFQFLLEPSRGGVVDVRLLFRRAFKELADQKGWPDRDIEMARVRVELTAE